MSQLISILDKSVIAGTARGSELADILFSKPPRFDLNVPVKNILLKQDNLEAMGKADYSIDDKDKNNMYRRQSCLDYTTLIKSGQ